MAIPLKYNLRSIRVRWRATLATVLGIALVVTVFIFVRSFAHGMEATYVKTGDSRNLIVLAKVRLPNPAARFPGKTRAALNT